MQENTHAHWSAYSWKKMDNEQRHKVVKLLEEEYGPDFAHQAKFGNEYCKPAVGPGKLLSGKKDLKNLDFYLERLLETIVGIRTLRPVKFYLPVVRKHAVVPSESLFCVHLVVGSKSMIESVHFSREDAEKQMAKMDELVNFSAVGAKREVKPFDESKDCLFDVVIWDYDKSCYVPHPSFPVHTSREKAIDRASHETRCTAAWTIKWETWKAAGCKKPEDYDYEKENVLTFDKKTMLVSHADPNCSDCWHFSETSYWKKLVDPEVDVAFLNFCSKL